MLDVHARKTAEGLGTRLVFSRRAHEQKADLPHRNAQPSFHHLDRKNGSLVLVPEKRSTKEVLLFALVRSSDAFVIPPSFFATPKKLYALRLLKRSALPVPVLVTVYRTCIRPILEYACEVWHGSLPAYLSDQLESIQK